MDIAAVFPELAPLARTAVRLHPRPGTPTAHDSSIGGPLLWPEDEPWPRCAEHAGPWHVGFSPREVRARRSALSAGWARARDWRLSLTPQEREAVDRVGHTGRRIVQDGPVPLLGALQLFARDLPPGAPGWPGPRGTDVLQVLWCPFMHGDGVPEAHLRWRVAAEVGRPLPRAPEPDVIEAGGHLPSPCVLHPEKVTEYPAPHELPRPLAQRVHAWEESSGLSYQLALSVACGWKLGGWGPWSFCDPWPMECPDCGGPVRPLLTAASSEWDGEGDWCPVEDSAAEAAHRPVHPPLHEPTEISMGRGYNLQVHVCVTSVDHTPLSVMQ